MLFRSIPYLGIPPERIDTPASTSPWPWPDSGVGRLFGYLRSDWPYLPAFVTALEATGHASVLHVPNASPSLRDRLSSETVTIVPQPLDLAGEVDLCDVVVSHGGHALTARALLVGCPLLMLPTQLEQRLTATRVAELGAGIVVADGQGRDAFDAALERVLTDGGLTERA